MIARYLIVILYLFLVGCCALVPRDKIFRKVEVWNPDEKDGEGFDHVSEMIRDLDLDRRKKVLVIGNIRSKRVLESYRRIVVLKDGSFRLEEDGGSMRFRMHPRLLMRLEGSGDWGNEASFDAICLCVRKKDGGLAVCIAIQFEGGPLFKVSDSDPRDRY